MIMYFEALKKLKNFIMIGLIEKKTYKKLFSTSAGIISYLANSTSISGNFCEVIQWMHY